MKRRGKQQCEEEKNNNVKRKRAPT